MLWLVTNHRVSWHLHVGAALSSLFSMNLGNFAVNSVQVFQKCQKEKIGCRRLNRVYEWVKMLLAKEYSFEVLVFDWYPKSGSSRFSPIWANSLWSRTTLWEHSVPSQPVFLLWSCHRWPRSAGARDADMSHSTWRTWFTVGSFLMNLPASFRS